MGVRQESVKRFCLGYGWVFAGRCIGDDATRLEREDWKKR